MVKSEESTLYAWHNFQGIIYTRLTDIRSISPVNIHSRSADLRTLAVNPRSGNEVGEIADIATIECSPSD